MRTQGARAVRYGLSTPTEIEELAEGFLAWGKHPDAFFVVLHGEVLART